MLFPMRRLWCSLVLTLCCAIAWSAPPATEYQVKAAYLFNFGQFVEWPAEAVTGRSTIDFCVVSADPIQSELEELATGEALGENRPCTIGARGAAPRPTAEDDEVEEGRDDGQPEEPEEREDEPPVIPVVADRGQD